MSSEEKELILPMVKTLIKEFGIKQTWLASQLEVSATTMSLYLNGNGGLGQKKIEKLNEIIDKIRATR